MKQIRESRNRPTYIRSLDLPEIIILVQLNIHMEVLGMVIHNCNPSYSVGRSRKMYPRPAPRKSSRPYLKNKLKAKGLGIW
jgi:hypothetical protein